MLKAIKARIRRTREFAEAAELIYEATAGDHLDSLILEDDASGLDDTPLVEEPEAGADLPEGDIPEEPTGSDDLGGDLPPATDDDSQGVGLDDIAVGDVPAAIPTDDPGIPGDEGPIGVDGTTPGGDIDDIGTGMGLDPVDDGSISSDGATELTSEVPVEEPGGDILGGITLDPQDIDDLLQVTVDLRSNTVTDTLPVPPANAADAVPSDDLMSMRVDSGFGESTIADARTDSVLYQEALMAIKSSEAPISEKKEKLIALQEAMKNGTLSEFMESDDFISDEASRMACPCDKEDHVVRNHKTQCKKCGRLIRHDKSRLIGEETTPAVTEAITLDGGGEQPVPAPDDGVAALDPLPGEEGAPAAEPAPAAEQPQSDVTELVLDKVNEAEPDPEIELGPDPAGMGAGAEIGKIADKLANVTKSVAEIQNLIIKNVAKN